MQAAQRSGIMRVIHLAAASQDADVVSGIAGEDQMAGTGLETLVDATRCAPLVLPTCRTAPWSVLWTVGRARRAAARDGRVSVIEVRSALASDKDPEQDGDADEHETALMSWVPVRPSRGRSSMPRVKSSSSRCVT